MNHVSTFRAQAERRGLIPERGVFVDEALTWRESDAMEHLSGTELPAEVVSLLLVEEMVWWKRSPHCASRRCRHRIGEHKDGVCTVDGCPCEGWVDE